jgi:putative ABC transport system permease protein
VTPGFFETIGAKIVQGRSIEEQDTAAARKVAVTNQAFAKRFFKNENPIGRHFGIDKIKYSTTYEIVGVVRDMRYQTFGYKEPVRPMFWVPEAQTAKYDETSLRATEIWSHYLYDVTLRFGRRAITRTWKTACAEHWRKWIRAWFCTAWTPITRS